MKETKAQIGDIITCRGRRVIISKITDQWYSEYDGWMIEGRDQNDRYFMWKQWSDGGTLEQREVK